MHIEQILDGGQQTSTEVYLTEGGSLLLQFAHLVMVKMMDESLVAPHINDSSQLKKSPTETACDVGCGFDPNPET